MFDSPVTIARIRFRAARWILALALAAAACSTLHGGPSEGTETGNPPIIDTGLVALVVSANEVRVTGKKGAVSPGGVEIEILSSLTGTTFRGVAAADGSFDIKVEASPVDIFEVRALQGTESSSAVYVTRGSAAVSPATGQGLTCKQREDLAAAQMASVAQTADTTCSRDVDCARAGTQTLCNDACSELPVSLAGAAEIADARSAIESGPCKTFKADGCLPLLFPCVPSLPADLRCVQSRCVLSEIGAPEDGGVAPPLDAGVMQARDAGSSTQVDAGRLMQVDGGPAMQVDAGNANDCVSNFDPGPLPAAISEYWYAPQANACLPRTYGGGGSNGNHYATLAACEAACKKTNVMCPPNRVLREVCIAGGFTGGCAERGTACALACSSAAACQGDPIGSWCAGGYCDATNPF